VEASNDTVRVHLRGSYDFERLERAVRDLQPLLQLDYPARIHLDLGGLVFIGPTAIALLEAALRRLEDEGLLVSGGLIVEPTSRLTAQYLRRMDFFRGLASVGDVPESFERRKPVGFRPCQEFTGEDDYWVVARDLTDALAERCQMDTLAKAAIRVCLDELAENVVQHADSPLGGFAAAQGMPKRHRFEIGIVDLGVGIRRSLSKNPRYADIKDDVIAIETALRPRVTSTPERNSGIGLSVTKLLLRDNGGSLLVRSGTGLVVGGAEDRAESTAVGLTGTLVAVRARTDRPLDLRAVYRRLPVEDDDETVDDD